MSDMKCNQVGCDHLADFRFTWPGKDEAGICEQHAEKLRGITAAMGLHVQLIPITPRVPSTRTEYGYIDPDGGPTIWLDQKQWLGFLPAYSREVPK